MANVDAIKVRRVDLYAADWLEGTSELSDVEFAIYTRACFLIYARGGPIRIELLRRVCTSHGNAFNHALKRIETMSKWERNGDEIDVKRCRNELERSSKRSRSFVENLSQSSKTNCLDEPLAHARARVRAGTFINHQSSKNLKDSKWDESGLKKVGSRFDGIPGHFDTCECPGCKAWRDSNPHTPSNGAA